ncbi:kinase-like protein [Obba rivulosa]|uniref:Kinase-like protein n=1 Tax=Obba rivulosa TaxID=1052685 RepID=A0A8E2B1T2_9APHY|nr:kinase-like protein [Obba rivulosa]
MSPVDHLESLSETMGTRFVYDDAAFSDAVEELQSAARGFENFRLWTDLAVRFGTRFDAEGAEVWYGAGPQYYVRIIDVPGKLSGDILRFHRDIPRYECNLEVIGDVVREIEFKSMDEVDHSLDDVQDAKELLYALPVVAYDKEIHFTKPPRTRREIEVLLKCRGSAHIAQLLGRTEDGRLVFPRYPDEVDNFMITAFRKRSIANIKQWMLGIIDAVRTIHTAGYTYRDFSSVNLLGNDPIILANLECTRAYQMVYIRWMAPELLAKDIPDDSDYTTASDVYGLGTILKLICHANNPRSPYVNWPMIPPFDQIYDACTRTDPAERPLLAELTAMLEQI